MIERIAVIVMAFISMGFLFGCGGSKSALDGTWYEQASENADRIEISGGRLRYLYGFETPDPVAYSGRFTLKDDGSRKQIELDKNAEFYEELFYDPGQDIIVSEMFVLDYGTMSHEFRRTPYVAPPEPVYGERIDLSDPDAPKEIRWDDAALIEMSFYETVDYSHYMMSTVFLPKTGRYEYAVRTENGVRMIASNFCSAEIPLPEETWEELRELADRYHLSDLNGLNIRTEDVPETVDDYTVRITYGDGGSFFSTANWKDVPGDWFNFMKLANEYLYKAFIDAGWNQETGEYEPWIPMKRFGEDPENREAALTIPVEEDVRKKTDEASGEYTKVTVDHFVTDDLENENLAAALETLNEQARERGEKGFDEAFGRLTSGLKGYRKKKDQVIFSSLWTDMRVTHADDLLVTFIIEDGAWETFGTDGPESEFRYYVLDAKSGKTLTVPDLVTDPERLAGMFEEYFRGYTNERFEGYFQSEAFLQKLKGMTVDPEQYGNLDFRLSPNGPVFIFSKRLFPDCPIDLFTEMTVPYEEIQDIMNEQYVKVW